MRTSLFLTLALAAGLQACGESNSQSESYWYEYEYNGCNTGKQKFESKEAMCSGLKSQSRNDYCAVQLREQAFKQFKCSGDFEVTN